MVDRSIGLSTDLLGEFLSSQGVIVVPVDSTDTFGNEPILRRQYRPVIVAMPGKAKRTGQQTFAQRRLQCLVKGGAVRVGQCGGTGDALPDT